MYPFLRLLLFAAIIPWIACNKDLDKPEPDPNTTLLTLTVDASFSTSQSDNWVLVHDINGKLLGYQPFEVGDSIVIEKKQDTADKKINITLIRFDPSLNYLNLQSYLVNDIGQQWTLQSPVYPSYENKIGQFYVNVTNVPLEAGFQFSNKNQVLLGTARWNSGVLDQTLDLHENARDFFFALNGESGIPKYLLLHNAKPGEIWNLSATLMKDFDKTVVVTFPSTFTRKILYTVNNVQPGQPNPKCGYVLNGNLTNTYVSHTETRHGVALGYLDMFTNYFTNLSVEYGNSLKYYYERLGTAPSKIQLPLNDSFSLTDKNIFQFRFHHNKPFLQRSSYWLYKEAGATLRWEVHAPPDAVQLYPDLPAELSNKFPNLTPAKLQHEASIFTVQGESYSDFLNFTFKKKPRASSYENYRIEVR